MTRAEFLAKHRPSQGCAPDQWEVEDAREKFARDLDSLLAAARAEALEEAAQPMEDDGMARHEDDEVRRVLARHVRRIRALVKP